MPNFDRHASSDDREAPGGSVDLVSVLYVVCGIPLMIVFFLVLFGLVGSCDLSNVMIPA
jgi:hypothetical protein